MSTTSLVNTLLSLHNCCHVSRLGRGANLEIKSKCSNKSTPQRAVAVKCRCSILFLLLECFLKAPLALFHCFIRVRFMFLTLGISFYRDCFVSHRDLHTISSQSANLFIRFNKVYVFAQKMILCRESIRNSEPEFARYRQIRAFYPELSTEFTPKFLESILRTEYHRVPCTNNNEPFCTFG